jgi:hypothetical protein
MTRKHLRGDAHNKKLKLPRGATQADAKEVAKVQGTYTKVEAKETKADTKDNTKDKT